MCALLNAGPQHSWGITLINFQGRISKTANSKYFNISVLISLQRQAPVISTFRVVVLEGMVVAERIGAS